MVNGESLVGSVALRLARDPNRRTRERPRCRPRRSLTGDALLGGVTAEMVALHERYHHRAPASAKTLLLGEDLLACVLGGVYTDVEKTMIELQRSTIVQETRSAFQSAMQHKFIEAVERLSGPQRARLHLQPPRRPRHGDRDLRARTIRMILGLGFALVSALGTSLSSLLKARGAPLARPIKVRQPLRSAADLFRSRWFAVGWVVALFAWVLHVIALSLAPLSSVQAILSGGLVFLAVLAERYFGFHLGRRQWAGLGLTAVGLVVLGLTAKSEGPQRSSLAALIAVEGAILALGIGLVRISTRRAIEHAARRSCSRLPPVCCSASPMSRSSTSRTRRGRCWACSARGRSRRWSRS